MNKNRFIEFSIVIPAYKRNDFVKEAILSVLNQKKIDLNKIEIIISDDEDDLKIQLANKKYFEKISKNILYIVNKHEEGPGGNRQTGFDVAIGEYVVFLDSDDTLKPFFLFEMRNNLKKYKSVACICLSNTVFEQNISIREKIKLLPLILIRDLGLLIGYLLNNKSVIPSSFYLCQMSHVMFKRNLIINLKFDYKYRHGGEDWDFFIKTMKKGTIRVLLDRLILFRYSSGSSTDDSKNRKKKWNSYKLLLKNTSSMFKRGIFHYLFLCYIRIFRCK